jgi:hypothetical protein
MLIFTDTTDPRISNIPPPYQPPVLSAIRTLLESSNHKSSPNDQGFVAFIEAEDTPESLTPAFVRPLLSNECAFRKGSCLIGVILWGNSGAGVTIVCPAEDGYAPEVASILKQHI